MAEKGGASAAVSALIAKTKLAGVWREKAERTNSGPVIVEVNWPKRELLRMVSGSGGDPQSAASHMPCAWFRGGRW